MSEETVVLASGSGELARRVAVTCLAIALSLVAQRVMLPYLDRDAMMQVVGGMGGLLSLVSAGSLQRVSWGASGLGPLVAAFLLVEAIAVTVPSLRYRRNSCTAARAPLTRAAWIVALALAAAQGWALADSLATVRSPFGHPVLEPGIVPMLGVTAGTIAGTAGLGAAAVLVTRHGLGNGFAVLLAVAAAQLALSDAFGALVGPREPWTEEGALLVIVAAALPFVLAARPRRGEGPRLPVPTCGLVPVEGTPAILAFPARLADWFPATAAVAAWLHALESEWAYVALTIPLTAGLALVLSRAFCPARDVVRAYERAAWEAPDGGATASVRRALRSAHVRSFVLAVGLAAIPEVAWFSGVPVTIRLDTIVAVFVVAAVARDLRSEVKARSSGGPLVSAWHLHHLYAVEPTVAALARAGIPAHARSRHYRALFHFFAPYAPVEILVPPDRATEASAISASVAAA